MMRLNWFDWIASKIPMRGCRYQKPRAKATGRRQKTFTFTVPTAMGPLKIVKSDYTQSQAKAQAKRQLIESGLLRPGQRLPSFTKIKVAA